MGSYQPISRIAIVGAGPVGVAFAKYLLAERSFQTIDIFEQRDRVGGLWNPSPTDRTQRIPIPQTNPRYGSRTQPIQQNGVKANGPGEGEGLINDSLEFESPLYDNLETNIPKQVMQYSDLPFSDDLPLYPHHTDVLRYLEQYAQNVMHLIRFETQVQDIRLAESSSPVHKLWDVRVKDLKTGQVVQGHYDAVVASSGHYTVPHIPDIKGLVPWKEAYPGAIIHSKAYRRPEDFKDQKVLIIGNSASGLDIGAQISQYSSHLSLAFRSDSFFGKSMGALWDSVDEVVEFLDPAQHNCAVKTASGRIISDLDRVVFATGYFYSFPFFSKFEPTLITDGWRARDTYRHFLHIEHPELALPVLSLRIIPFGLAENQAAIVARLWSGRLPMPSKAEMRAWEEQEFTERGSGKHFHVKTFPNDCLQMNELYRWAASARKVPGLENDGQGKMGILWNERMVWERSQFPAMKATYASKGAERTKVKTIEELGFVYEDWLKHSKAEDREIFRQAKCSPDTR